MVLAGEASVTAVVKENICWDVDLEREFKGPRRTGFTFVIDVCDGIPRLALYRMKLSCSISVTLKKQPPSALLEKAVAGRDGSLPADNLCPVDSEVRLWIEQNLLPQVK